MVYVIFKAGISSFLASLGFGFLFNIKGRNLWFAGVVGAIGGVCYKVGLYLDCSEILSNFYGALGLALASEILARQCKTPVTTFFSLCIDSISSWRRYVSYDACGHSWGCSKHTKYGASNVEYCGCFGFGNPIGFHNYACVLSGKEKIFRKKVKKYLQR